MLSSFIWYVCMCLFYADTIKTRVAPGWLSWLSVQLDLGSGYSSSVSGLTLAAQSLLRILSLSLSLSLPLSHSFSLSK